MHSSHDTIFALSSGVVPAGIAVVRVSGPMTRELVASLCGSLPPVRQMRLASLRAADGGVIDHALVVRFEAPNSFTGEDCAEFHLHGSRAVVARLHAELASRPAVRPADAGEFTLRAFRNGRVDLTEAEALSDLISAETEAQRQFAIEHAGGQLRALYDGWRAEIVEMMALAEASIDFADEDDIPDGLGADLAATATALAGRIDRHLADAGKAEIIREGFRVVLVGAPNAGKSSLLNRIAGREVAIVTHEAGTTRDVLSVDLDLGGVLVKLSDTAGLREAEGLAERIGVARSIEEIHRSHLVLLVEDLSDPQPAELPALSVPIIRIGNKADLVPAGVAADVDIRLSAADGSGIDTLLAWVEQHAVNSVRHAELIPSRKRHGDLLRACVTELRRVDARDEISLQLENLRLAAHHLGRITGRVDVEDLLDLIFSRFCIGK